MKTSLEQRISKSTEINSRAELIQQQQKEGINEIIMAFVDLKNKRKKINEKGTQGDEFIGKQKNI